MQRNMSYRKPAPIFVPSPPLSPSSSLRLPNPPPFGAGRQQDKMPSLPQDWRDIIEQANGCRDDPDNKFACTTLCEPLGVRRDDPGPELPRSISPVYLSSTPGTSRTGQHRIYRPPTPPRHFKRPYLPYPDFESRNASELSLDQRYQHFDLASRRLEGTYSYAPSIATSETYYSRRPSSISLFGSNTDWQLSQLPIYSQRNNQPWWEKIKMLGVLIKNRMRIFKEAAALC
ncbi:hypothetical protein B0H10DRAFT_92804 [Mycena sp. CBHHK59/15]|nr:hypothetical protein B0H10DRAFT_92804 [Mycena sp. CBHHK59/15]